MSIDFAMPSLRLDGRVALVTGGGRGLGAGVALALAHAGADVAIVARTASQVDAAATHVRGLGRQAHGIVADVADPEAPSAIVQEVVSRFGRLDVLVHAAGINIREPADADHARRLRAVDARERRERVLPGPGSGARDAGAGPGPHHRDRLRRGGDRHSARLGVRDEQGRTQADGEVAGARVGGGRDHGERALRPAASGPP